jgi:diacylglycerol kinase family enzyme
VRTAASIQLEFDAPQFCQRDGELDRLDSAAVSIECVPAALRIVAQAESF